MHVLIVCRCSYPFITSVGFVFEIKEDRNLPWNLPPNWLWYRFIHQNMEARCVFLFSSDLSLLTEFEGCIRASVSTTWVPASHSSTMEPTFPSL
jgi:hypothetical protein